MEEKFTNFIPQLSEGSFHVRRLYDFLIHQGVKHSQNMHQSPSFGTQCSKYRWKIHVTAQATDRILLARAEAAQNIH